MKEYKLTPIETDIAENAATQEEINSLWRRWIPIIWHSLGLRENRYLRKMM